MRDRRSIWLVLVVVASSVLVGGTACGHGAGTTASEELIRLAKGSEESLVRSLIGKEATARGTNADEAANLWVTRFTSAHVAYQEISPHARAVGCEAVTSWLGALATPTTDDDLSAHVQVALAIANLNSVVSNRALVADLQGATERAANGEPIYLTVLMMKTGLCQVVG